MARKNRKKALQLIGLILGVGLIITVIVIAVDKFSDRAIEDPNALTIEWKKGDEDVVVKPYRVCDLFEQDACTVTEANAAHIKLGLEETGELNVGKEVGSGKWTVQRFFSDESVNSESVKEPGEAMNETIAGSTSVNGERTPLGVVEVSTAVVGKNAAGEETTYGITWSIVNDSAAM
ncbi:MULTISPECIES: DUF2771 family protein [unclassified Corynebacterium]|uniref:DUF2771 family protein n=1 Tax=unclassified Corynebacterium TaxID=2624378 RepID=UPI0030B30773